MIAPRRNAPIEDADPSTPTSIRLDPDGVLMLVMLQAESHDATEAKVPRIELQGGAIGVDTRLVLRVFGSLSGSALVTPRGSSRGRRLLGAVLQ
jgi:hypothetical protein